MRLVETEISCVEIVEELNLAHAVELVPEAVAGEVEVQPKLRTSNWR